MITIERVTKRYGETYALRDVSLHIPKGRITGIIGYSGAGKSTLLRLMNGLERPTSGRVFVDGVDVTTLSRRALQQKRQSIGMIFQQFALLSTKTVAANVAFALRCAGVPKEQHPKRVAELLNLVGLSDRANHYPSELSGGQKQRVGIARALANDPDVLLCDEATSALDPTTTASILQLLQTLQQSLGLTIVLITHELDVIRAICDDVVVMEDGRIIERSDVYDLFAHPATELSQTFVREARGLNDVTRLPKHANGTRLLLTFTGPEAYEPILTDTTETFGPGLAILGGHILTIQNRPLGTLLVEWTGPKECEDALIDALRQRVTEVEVLSHERLIP